MLDTLHIKFERLYAESERKKRGAVNFIGTAAKFLFGTMDEEDRNQILNKIDRLGNDNLNNIKFNFEYAKLIEKTVANMNTSIEICNRNGKLLGLLDAKVREIAYHSELTERAVKFFHFIKELQQIFYLMNTETSDKITELHQMLIDLHNNVFNTKLYGYKDILESLRSLKITNKNLELPINLANPNFSLLRHLIKYCLVKKDENYYLIYSLPLVEIDRLNLNKLYPIPEIKDNMASYLDFDAEFLLTNRHYDRFQLWEKSQLDDNCIKHEQSYFCKNLQLLRNDKDSCAVKLMTENFKNLKSICSTKVSKLNEHLFIKTKNDNTYISLAPSEETGTLVTGKKVRNLKFKGTQMLQVQTDSLLSLETIQIKFFNNTSAAMERQINLTSNFDFDVKEPIWHKISVPSFEKTQIIDNKKFADIGVEWKILDEKANDMISVQATNVKLSWIVFLVIAIAVGLLVASVAIILLRKFKRGEEDGTGNDDNAINMVPMGLSNSLPAL